MWFAGDHGVARYNGYRFDIFNSENGLTDNTVFDLQEDDDGLIWFVTYTGGLCYYDGKGIRPHPLNDSVKAIFARQFPTSVKVLADKCVWMGVVGKGVYKVTGTTCTFFPFEKAGAPDSLRIYVLNLENDKFIYTSGEGCRLTTIKDPSLLNMQEFTTTATTFKYTNLNYALVKAGNNEIVVGIWQYLIGLSGKELLWRKEWPRDKKILFVKKLPDGSIWVTNSKAPAYKLALNNKAVFFSDSIVTPGNISDINNLPGGAYWLTTLDKGIYFLPNRHIKVYNIPLPVNNAPVSCLAANKKYLYVALPYNVIMAVDRNLKSSFSKGRDEPVGVTGMVLSDSGRLMTNLEVPFNWTKKGFFITKMVPYGTSQMLIGGDGGFAITKGADIVKSSHDLGFRERVTDLVHLNEQYVIGTTKGLYFLSVASDGSLKLKKEERLGDVRITGLAVTGKKMAVATRGKGVFVFDKGSTYSIKKYEVAASSQAECLLFENDTTLWVGTYEGVEKILLIFSDSGGLSTRVRTYNRQDGLPGTQVNCIAAFGGFIWVSTTEGVCYFNPATYNFETQQVPLYFSNLYVNGKIRDIDKNEMAYYEDNIRIDFAALYYNAPANLRYKIKLNNEDWIYTNSNSATYYSLPSGKYQLQVQAEDLHGKYLSNVGVFQFVITPHFTETVWFKLVIALLLLLLVVSIIAVIFRFQKMRAENLIKLLQYEFKALNYQINPHFVFNVLNSIQYFVIKKDSDRAVFFLNAFSRLIRKIVSNSKQQHISVSEEVDFLQEYLDLERLRLDGKFEFTIEIKGNVDVQAKTLLPMILQPIVENSIWHGIVPADRLGNIDIRFVKNFDCVVCEIEDDGVGLNFKSNKNKPQGLSLALSNVKERLKIAAEMYDSEWALTIENKKEINGEDGTIVTIKFPHAKE